MNFYVELLATRQRSLKAQLAALDRWDEARTPLQEELDAVEEELAVINDAAVLVGVG
jgi:hypothetical protein